MSGAGRIKGDGSDDESLFEVKDAKGQKGMRVTEQDIETLWVHAAKTGKRPVFIIEFEKYRLVGEIETT